jgi:hypothetical protein
LFEEAKHGIFVSRILNRYVAIHRDGANGRSCLNVKKLQQTVMHVNLVANGDNEGDVRMIRAEPKEDDPIAGLPNAWYEASISSVMADELLRQNSQLTWGDYPDWMVKDMEENGAISALYRPALAMISLMDLVGCHNDNQQKERVEREETYGRNGQFW